MNWILGWLFIVITWFVLLYFVRTDVIEYHEIKGELYLEIDDTLHWIPESERFED